MTASWRDRVGPWLLPTVLLIELTLVVSGLLDIGVAVGVAVAVEVLLLLTAIGRANAALRSVRGARTTGRDPWSAAEDGLSSSSRADSPT